MPYKDNYYFVYKQSGEILVIANITIYRWYYYTKLIKTEEYSGTSTALGPILLVLIREVLI
jgi:hypothetical protein